MYINDLQFLTACSTFVNSNMFNCMFSDKKRNLKTNHPTVQDMFQNLIKYEDVKDLVKKSISSNSELIDFRLIPFSEDKLGYLGSHFSLIVTGRQPGHENELRNFFLKTLPYEVPGQVAYVQEKGCFRKETKFFNLVVPLMTDNFRGERWVPKCYSAKHNVMIFKDMKPKGFSNRNRLLDEKCIEAAFECIARMHASSLLAEEKFQGRSLRDLFPDVFEESEFLREGSSFTALTVGVKLAIDLAKDMGLDSSNIQRAGERIFGVGQSSKTKSNVVCHGDLWSSNLIFDHANHCRLVDFQMVRYLPPAHDLMLLLYYGAATEVRQHERQLVEHYYRVFIDTLELNNFKGNVPGFEELLQGIAELRLPALFTAVLYHPIVLLDTSTASKIMSNPTTCEAIFFGDRKSIVKDYMAKNHEYKKKIQENIKEFVDMSLLIDSIPEYT
ncbi:uncharacterized protein LOC131671128 [Phymastichus coffea]|uniref:uncharacterized protein LOC131671128 n=1 Tax=Phymastichus coffea TaxID=108790 RepID=UPI00273AB8F2|nr:uncharacterized protein LOC131671128 [Phymastichus coffea]